MLRKLSFLILIILFQLFPFSFVLADEGSMALTIIPPLMKMNMKPGEIINTAIRIVNNNKENIFVYTKILDFKGKAEGGVEFIENTDSYRGTELEKFFSSGWITIGQGPIEISAMKSKDIPFLIEVPADASPGGHYAAILVGTKPPEETSGTVVKVSSYVSSLILISIAGDIEERGGIREFSTNKKIYREPKVDLKINFQNFGNVHLRPQGEIRIFNIFGKEKGNIPINLGGNFGNVLPKGERNWEFTWETTDDIFILDRFKAELNLSFGEEAKQSDYQVISFWVINFKALLIFVGLLLFVLILFILFIRFYIKQSVKSLKMQMGVSDVYEEKSVKKEKRKEQANKTKKLAEKIVDLRKTKR